MLIRLQFPYISENVTLIGHNWGFLAGIHVLQSHPDWFDSLVILNTNNLPDGEVDPSRFSSPLSLLKYLKYDAYFLAFHSAMGLLKTAFPLSLLYSAMNFRYSQKDKRDFMAPFQVIYVHSTTIFFRYFSSLPLKCCWYTQASISHYDIQSFNLTFYKLQSQYHADKLDHWGQWGQVNGGIEMIWIETA